MQSFNFTHECDGQKLLIEYFGFGSTLRITDEIYYMEYSAAVFLKGNIKRTSGTSGKESVSEKFFLEKLVELANNKLNPAINFKFVPNSERRRIKMSLTINDLYGNNTGVDISEYSITMASNETMCILFDRFIKHITKTNEQSKIISEQQKTIERLESRIMLIELRDKMDLNDSNPSTN